MAAASNPSPPRFGWVAPSPKRNIIVGMADMSASNDPNSTLVTYSLGSCVGVSVYDPVARVGGLLHVKLPDSTINPELAAKQPYIFVDTGVPALFHAVYAMGAIKHRIVVKLVGGAQFLDEKGIFNIGTRNAQATLAILARNGVVASGTALGGQHSRTVRLDVANGTFTIEIPGYEPFTL